MRSSHLILSLLFSLSFLFASAQKKQLLSDDSEIIAKAQEFLQKSAESGELKQKVAELSIKGQFVLDITLHKNGNVLTIFSPFEIADEKVRPQNQLKDLLMACEFPFKLPKNKRVKFRQTFIFS